MSSEPAPGPASAWQALAARRFLLGPWPWRAVAYLLTSVAGGFAVLVGLVLVLAVGTVTSVVGVGLPLLALSALAGVPVAALERRRLRLADPVPLSSGHRLPERAGLWSWVRTRFQEPLTWRESGYTLLYAVVLWPVEALALCLGLGGPLLLLATPVLLAVDGHETRVLKLWLVTGAPAACACAAAGLLLLPAALYGLTVLAAARAALTRQLIGPPRSEKLASRVVELRGQRLRLAGAFEAERRRIERDLHDGAQQRLVALTMELGLARLDAPAGALADRLARAHGEAGRALDELRELIHGIHPKVLSDFGLVAAVEDAADRSPVPVDVTLALPGRLPAPVETTAYFVVSEALANVAKHSGARLATVSGGRTHGGLRVEVRDDGCGGADVTGGTGLSGLADRAAVLDGTITLSSPPGGPTVLRLDLPLESECPSPPPYPRVVCA